MWFAEYRLPSGRLLDVFVEPGDSDPMSFVAIAGRLIHPAVAAEPRLFDQAVREHAGGHLADRGLETTTDELARRLVWERLLIVAGDVPLVYVYREAEPDLLGGREPHVYADPELCIRDIGYYRPGSPVG